MARAAASAVALARTLDPDQLDRPTNCPDWTVRDLANHLTLWSGVVSERSARRLPPPGDGSEAETLDFTAGGDWPDVFADRVGRAVAAWDAPGALDGDTVMMGDPRPAVFIHDMLFGELVLHGWDLAAATGLPFQVDEDLAGAALACVEALAEQGREWGVFGPEVVAPPDATTLERALALSGRDPAWRP